MADIRFLYNLSKPHFGPLEVKPCRSFLCRLRGLTFRRSLPPNWGLLLVQRRESRLDTAIHMLWMRLDLAVVWIDSKGFVVDAQAAYRWRSFLAPGKAARYVLETSLAYLEHFEIGDEIRFEESRPD